MLYLGHFSFDVPTDDDEDDADDARHGYFSVLAEAESIDEAFDKFRKLIPGIGVQQEIFARGTQVWLDSCIEVRSLPAEGVLAHMVVAVGDEGSISASLVGAPAGVGEAYGWGAPPEGDDDEADGGDTMDDARVASADTGASDDDDDDAEEDFDDESADEPFLVIE